MAEQFDNSGYTQEDNTSDLRKQISLTSALMVDLVSDDGTFQHISDKFIDKLKQLNDSGVSYIQQQQYQMALIYLQEAEKILQYAASCGKTIDRSIIISTLQNQACVYQRLWELQKASNYLEAIIFNMNAYLQCTPDVSIDQQIFDIHSNSYSQLSMFIKKRMNMAFYYLQFSAVSSQNKKHDVALGSAFKALSILKMVCEECYNFQKYIRKGQKVSEGTSSILKELSHLKQTVDLQKMQKYLLLAKRGIIKLQNRHQDNKVIEEVSNFAIGQVMQISPIEMDELLRQPKIKDEVTFIQKIFKAIYISICFFTIATQLRLISAENYLESEIQQSPEYRKSQIFHLNAIILASKYVPCETRYLEHIIKSFGLHYKIDLLERSESENQRIKDQVLDEIGGNGLLVHGIENGHSMTLSNKKIKETTQPDTQDVVESPMIKIATSKHDLTTKLQTQNFSSEKSLENKHRSPSYELKRKKKHSKGHPDQKKEKIINFNSHNIHKDGIYGTQFGRNSSFAQGNRKSSIHKKGSQEKLKFLMPSKNRSNRNTKQKQLKAKQKSRDKSKSQSRNKISIEKNHMKEKSADKIKKKNHKLSEEYFMKPIGKKKGANKAKGNSSKSMKKKGNNDEYLSSSRILNTATSPHGNTFIGMKKSTIRSPNKVKL